MVWDHEKNQLDLMQYCLVPAFDIIATKTENPIMKESCDKLVCVCVRALWMGENIWNIYHLIKTNCSMLT
jgi:hypothetical protein